MSKQLETSTVLYIHLQLDGGIFVLRPNNEASYVSEATLRTDLEAIKRANGVLRYSREHQATDPPQHVSRTFELIATFNIPIQLVEPYKFIDPPPQEYVPSVIHASFHSDLPWLRELVERGVDLDVRDRFGQSGLMMAANANQLESVKVLLDAGAPVNVTDDEGNTPLMFASQQGSEEIVQLLIDAGAELSAKASHGLDALAFAKQNGHTHVIRLLQSNETRSGSSWWKFWER